MTGDEQVRFCSQCNLHVYNFAELTEEQIATLLATTGGRLCARLYQRADGTILTRDCPVGVRAATKRVARMAGAVLTAVLSLCAGALGQTQTKSKQDACTNIPALKIKQTPTPSTQTTFTGTVIDPAGAVMPGAIVTLTNEQTKQKLITMTGEMGEFALAELPAGQYTLEIAAVGFKQFKQKHLPVRANETFRVDAIVLAQEGITVTVGILVDSSSIEYSNGELRISGETIRKLPLPE